MGRSFDGSTSNAYVDIGNITNSFSGDVGPWTVVCFYKCDDFTDERTMVGKNDASNRWFTLQLDNQNPSRIQVKLGSLTNDILGSTSINTGTWYMSAVTNDGTGAAGTATLYTYEMDGTVIDNGVTGDPDASEPAGETSIAFGHLDKLTRDPFDGDIAYVAYVSNEITDTQEFLDYLRNPIKTAARWKDTYTLEFFCPLIGTDPEPDWSDNQRNGTLNNTPGVGEMPPVAAPGAFLFDAPVAAASGPQTVSLNSLTLASSAPALTVSPGAVSIATNSLTLASSPQALTVAVGAVSIGLNSLTLASSPETITIVPGSVSIATNSLTLAGSAETLTVSSTVSIALNSLSLASSAETLTVTPGAVSIALNSITLASSAETLTVSLGLIVSLNSLTLTSSAETLTIVPGATTVTLNSVSLAGSAETLTVSPGTIAIALNSLSLASSPETITVVNVGGGLIVVLDSLTLTGSAETLSLATGATSVLLDTLTLASSAQALSITGGLIVGMIEVIMQDRSTEIIMQERSIDLKVRNR